MDHENFIADLQDHVKAKVNVWRMNNGGCGFFARYVHEGLTQRGLESRILAVASEREKGILSRNWPTSFSHVYLQLGKLYFDADTMSYTNGIFFDDTVPSFDGGGPKSEIVLPYDHLKKSTGLLSAHWNHSFTVADRKLLRDVIKEYLK